MSSIIRKYVHLGLINEKNTQHAEYSLRDKVVRKSLFRLMDEFMSPMQTAINEFREENKALKNVIRELLDKKKSDAFELQMSINSLREDLLLEFGNISTDKYSELSFKNLVILRTVFYVFLLGYHHKKIPPHSSAEDAWIEIVKIVHNKAGEMSLEELAGKDTEGLEKEIKRLAGATYTEAMKVVNLNS